MPSTSSTAGCFGVAERPSRVFEDGPRSPSLQLSRRCRYSQVPERNCPSYLRSNFSGENRLHEARAALFAACEHQRLLSTMSALQVMKLDGCTSAPLINRAKVGFQVLSFRSQWLPRQSVVVVVVIIVVVFVVVVVAVVVVVVDVVSSQVTHTQTLIHSLAQNCGWWQVRPFSTNLHIPSFDERCCDNCTSTRLSAMQVNTQHGSAVQRMLFKRRISIQYTLKRIRNYYYYVCMYL